MSHRRKTEYLNTLLTQLVVLRRRTGLPHKILLDEARGLIDQGVREINLVAQDLSMYGMDRWPDVRLPQLLRALSALEGDFWIRCLYYYPYHSH